LAIHINTPFFYKNQSINQSINQSRKGALASCPLDSQYSTILILSTLTGQAETLHTLVILIPITTIQWF